MHWSVPSWQAGRLGCSTQTNIINAKKPPLPSNRDGFDARMLTAMTTTVDETDMVCDHHWTCEPPQVQRKMSDRSTFALPNEIYLKTVSHFRAANQILGNLREGLWLVVRHDTGVNAGEQRILNIILKPAEVIRGVEEQVFGHRN